MRGSTSGTLLPLAMKVNRSSTNEAGGSAPVEDVEGALRFKTASPLDKRPFWVALKARSAGNARGHGWGSVACGVCGVICIAKWQVLSMHARGMYAGCGQGCVGLLLRTFGSVCDDEIDDRAVAQAADVAHAHLLARWDPGEQGGPAALAAQVAVDEARIVQVGLNVLEQLAVGAVAADARHERGPRRGRGNGW